MTEKGKQEPIYFNPNEWIKNEISLVKGNLSDEKIKLYEEAEKILLKLLSEDYGMNNIHEIMSIIGRLVNRKPLTPIEDKEEEWYVEKKPILPKNCKGISCGNRITPLVKYTKMDDEVKYIDMDRVECVNLKTRKVFESSFITELVYNMYPITLPYYIPDKNYRVYLSFDDRVAEWVVLGIFRAVWVERLETPNGDIVPIDKCFKYKLGNGGNYIEITKDEYNEIMERVFEGCR